MEQFLCRNCFCQIYRLVKNPPVLTLTYLLFLLKFNGFYLSIILFYSWSDISTDFANLSHVNVNANGNQI